MNDRQTGRTTKQMLGAPAGSVFVWVNHHLAYPEMLARGLGRDDLVIKPPSWLTQRNTRGRELHGLVIDHAAVLDDDQVYAVSCARIKTPNAIGQGSAACGASPAPKGCAANGTNNERTEK